MNFKRYSLNDIHLSRFYQMPKFLFEGAMKSGLSNDAKVLYSLLRDRHELSLANGWLNDKHEVYLIFSRKEMCDALGLGETTIRKIINELKSNDLMEEERQGLNRPNLIFLNYVDMNSFPRNHEKSLETSYESNVLKPESPEPQNPRVKTVKISQSRTLGIDSQEPQIITPNDTNINKTYQNDTDNQSINHSIEQWVGVEKAIKENIDYEHLKIHSSNDELEMIDEMIQIILEVLCTSKGTVRIRGEDMTAQIVKNQLLKLNSEHINYVLRSMKDSKSKIINIKAYLLTALCNAPSTMNTYYTNLVNHDMYNRLE